MRVQARKGGEEGRGEYLDTILHDLRRTPNCTLQAIVFSLLDTIISIGILLSFYVFSSLLFLCLLFC